MLLIYFAGVSEASLHISHAQLLNVPIHLILVLWVGVRWQERMELWNCISVFGVPWSFTVQGNHSPPSLTLPTL